MGLGDVISSYVHNISPSDYMINVLHGVKEVFILSMLM